MKVEESEAISGSGWLEEVSVMLLCLCVYVGGIVGSSQTRYTSVGEKGASLSPRRRFGGGRFFLLCVLALCSTLLWLGIGS